MLALVRLEFAPCTVHACMGLALSLQHAHMLSSKQHMARADQVTVGHAALVHADAGNWAVHRSMLQAANGSAASMRPYGFEGGVGGSAASMPPQTPVFSNCDWTTNLTQRQLMMLRDRLQALQHRERRMVRLGSMCMLACMLTSMLTGPPQSPSPCIRPWPTLTQPLPLDLCNITHIMHLSRD